MDYGAPSVMMRVGGSLTLMLLAGRWGLKVPMTVIGHTGEVDPVVSLSGWVMLPVQEVNPN